MSQIPEGYRHWTPAQARADADERGRLTTSIEMRLRTLRDRSRRISKAAATLEMELEDIAKQTEELQRDVERFAELWPWDGYL